LTHGDLPPSGDLAARNLSRRFAACEGPVAAETEIVGVARSPFTDHSYRDQIRESGR